MSACAGCGRFTLNATDHLPSCAHYRSPVGFSLKGCRPNNRCIPGRATGYADCGQQVSRWGPYGAEAFAWYCRRAQTGQSGNSAAQTPERNPAGQDTAQGG